MTLGSLIKAMREAERFLEAARTVKTAAQKAGSYVALDGRDTARVKRASLDLSMALAEMRSRKWTMTS